MKTAEQLTKIVLTVMVITTLAACQPSAQEQGAGASQPAPQVSVANVVSERITEWDEFTGRLEAMNF